MGSSLSVVDCGLSVVDRNLSVVDWGLTVADWGWSVVVIADTSTETERCRRAGGL